MVKINILGCTVEAESIVDYKTSNLELFLGARKRVNYALEKKDYLLASRLQENLIRRYEALFADSFKKIKDCGIDYKKINLSEIKYSEELKNKQLVGSLTDSEKDLRENLNALRVYAMLRVNLSEYKDMTDKYRTTSR